MWPHGLTVCVCISPCNAVQRETLLGSRSYAAGHMEEGLSEAYLTVEQWMHDPAARQELYCLREGEAIATAPRIV